MSDIKNIIESLLFVSDSPLTVEQIKSVLERNTPAEIRDAIGELTEGYASRGGAIVLCEVAGGFQLRTRPEYKDYILKLREPSPLKLSRAAMETLAIVAYQQPVLRSEVEHIRGVNSGNTLRYLQETKLIRILGRRDVPGRPLVYGTTRTFLETFELKSLKDLPQPEEIEGITSPRSAGNPKPQTLPLPLQESESLADEGDQDEQDEPGNGKR